MPAISSGTRSGKRSSKKSRATSTKKQRRTTTLHPPLAHLTGTRGGDQRPVGKYERLAYERQQRDLLLAYGSNGVVDESLFGDPALTKHPKGFWWDPVAASRPVEFIQRFWRHHKGEWAGQPLVLEPWQQFCDHVTYGWRRPDGSRRFRISYREVPRKNGKTEQAAGEGVYLEVADGEAGAEVYSTATKEDQAKLVWEAAKEAVKKSPDLLRFVTPRQKALVCARTGSTFKPLGADSETLDGLNPHGHVCDEMHAHKKRGVWDVMISGMGARRQPLTIVITTAGVYNPESIGWELHIHAQQVLDGVLEDDTFFAIIFAADDGDDPFDEDTWKKANPNYGVSVKPSFLAEQAQTAKLSPSALNTFLRLHLNVWTQQVTKWITKEDWDACEHSSLRGVLDDAALSRFKGRMAYLGTDLSAKIDIAALAIILPDTVGFDAFWRFYIPEGVIRRRAQANKLPDYAAWEKDGWLTKTPGDVIDYDFIRRDIVHLRSFFTIRQLGYDPWNATQFANDLQHDGFTTDPEADTDLLVEMRQGMATLSEPCKEFEKLIVDRKFRHGGNPVMRWMIDNAVIRKDANENIAPDKKSATGKIDGVVSTVMALGRAILRPQLVTSVYETRGVRSF